MQRLDDLARRLAIGGGLLASCTLVSIPCAVAQDSLFQESRPAMGTTVEILLYASSRGRAAELLEAAFEEIERVEAALSSYRPTSEINRINTAAAQAPVVTDPEVFDLIANALDVSRRSDGAFDITVGALVRAWGFFRADGRFPSPDELASARAAVGWQGVVLDGEHRSIRFRAPGMALDLGGIGKGFALDRAAEILRRGGVTAALLGAGQSSHYAIGAPPSTAGWPIVVPNPHDPERPLSRVHLRDASLSTSGSGRQFFEYAGTRYSHVIDPRTGVPVTGMTQVTITARSATDSDALATALFVAGPARATGLLEQYGAGALMVTAAEPEAAVPIAWIGSAPPQDPGARRLPLER
jgi:thiamine biosynthesis lipoprotein